MPLCFSPLTAGAATAPVLLLLLLVFASSSASALSTTACDSTATTWVSESPRLQGQFPHYQQLFFCSGNINVEGKAVDACVDSGKACDGAAAAAGFCRYLGFDGAIYDQVLVTEISDGNIGTPARSVTGEWCTGFGYDDALGDALDREGYEKLVERYKSSLPAPPPQPCSVLERVACYRTRDTLRSAWKAAGEKARSVAVEQQLPGPSFAPRVGGGGGGAPAAAEATTAAAAVAAASSPAPAPRADTSSVAAASVKSSSSSSDAAVEDSSSASAPSSSSSSSSGSRRLMSP